MRIILTIDACPEKLQWRLPLNDHHEQIFYQCDPNLYLGALTIEIPEREVLLQLLEEQLYLPSFAVYIFVQNEGGKRAEFRIQPFFCGSKRSYSKRQYKRIKDKNSRLAMSRLFCICCGRHLCILFIPRIFFFVHQ